MTEYLTVCAKCGSDSIVDSKYGTDDGFCDMCETFADCKEILAENYNPLRSDYGVYVEELDAQPQDFLLIAFGPTWNNNYREVTQ